MEQLFAVFDLATIELQHAAELIVQVLGCRHIINNTLQVLIFIATV